MRRVPSAWSVTSPADLSTLRCCETAGRLTGSCCARSPTALGELASRSKIARRVGSASAVSTAPWLVMTYGKLQLTNEPRQGAPPAREADGSSVDERPGEPEGRQRGVVEPGDRADLAARQRDHHEPERPRHLARRVAQVGSKGRLAVGPGR